MDTATQATNELHIVNNSQQVKNIEKVNDDEGSTVMSESNGEVQTEDLKQNEG